MTKPKLPQYLYLRGNILWYRLPNIEGKWVNKSTGYRHPQELEAAERMVKSLVRGLKARREQVARGEGPAATTFRAYVAKWLDDRDAREVASAGQERTRLTKYVLPELGDLDMTEVRPRHIRDLVRTLRARRGPEKIAPRTIIHIYNIVHNVFESAVIDEIVIATPVKVAPGELPKKVDADPEWRSQATYTVPEVQKLLSAPIIPAQRRVLYALKSLAGMRHGEAAALMWRSIDFTMEPLPKINVVQAWDTPEREVKSTKDEHTRAVPMHPVLGAIIEAWRSVHWKRVYGREPTPDDFVVPTRNFTCIDGSDAVSAFHDDLDALELRKEAGKVRLRGGHDLRSWYKTRLVEDGAEWVLIRRTTHAPPKDVDGGYDRYSWGAICREVAKLKITLDGAPLQSVTSSLQADAKAGGRWRKDVTPKGLEAPFRAPSNEHLMKTAGYSMTASERSRARTVTEPVTAGRMIERALLVGDTTRALRIARELRGMGRRRENAPRDTEVTGASGDTRRG